MISFNTGLSLAAAVIPGGGAWTPAKEPGGTFNLWLDGADAATITQSGGLVSQWSDKSGAGNHATQSTSAKQPAPTAGGGVDFSTSKFLTSNLPSNLDAQSIFAVIDVAALSGDRTILGPATAISGQRQLRLSGAAPASIQILRSGVALENATGSAVSTGGHIIGATINGVGANSVLLYLDGVQNGLANSHSTFGSANTTSIAAKDASSGGAEFLNGIVREILSVPTVADTALAGKINAYLKSRWGTP